MADYSEHFGKVYFDAAFRFQDGTIGEKRFVVICASPEFELKVVVLRTTSQNKGGKSYGCNLDDRFQNFYLPPESGVFSLQTWIMLDYATEYFVNRLGTGRANYKNKLGPIAFKDLLECVARARDIELDIRSEANMLARSL